QHYVDGLITRVDWVGPDGWEHSVEFPTWNAREDLGLPYLPFLTGERDAKIEFITGVNNIGHLYMKAWFMGEPLPWYEYEEIATDQHTPPSGQYAKIKITPDSAEFWV